MKLLVETNTRALSLAILLVRVMAGLILFVAGAGKILGWFGGFGMNATLDAFKTSMHLSEFWIYVSCYAEFIGGFLVLVGLFTRVAATALFINMLVATVSVGFQNFFMGGAAYPCLLMVVFLALLLSGPMAYSIDALLTGKNRTDKTNLSFGPTF